MYVQGALMDSVPSSISAAYAMGAGDTDPYLRCALCPHDLNIGATTRTIFDTFGGQGFSV